MASPNVGWICTALFSALQVFHGFATVKEIEGNRSVSVRQPQNISSEYRLLRDLLRDYTPFVRPVINSSMAVRIELGMTLTQILDLDEKNQVLTTNVWLETQWTDEKLIWDPDQYQGLKNIRIPYGMVWLPDIVLYNSADDYTNGYMPALAMVRSNGTVFWGPVVRFRTSCKIDITYFPFDDQVCKMKMGSWAYNGFEVDVVNKSATMDISNFVDNGEWKLVNVWVKRNVVYYPCCAEPFPDVTFYVHLRRRITYYVMNIITPCVILSILCLAGFLLPAESGEKVNLGLSVLLTLTVFMLMVADKTPQTSESISIIGIYLLVVLTSSCLSILTAVFILSLHHQRGQAKPVPQWVKSMCFRYLAPALCVKIRDVYNAEVHSTGSCPSKFGTGQSEGYIYRSDPIRKDRITPSIGSRSSSLRHSARPKGDGYELLNMKNRRNEHSLTPNTETQRNEYEFTSNASSLNKTFGCEANVTQMFNHLCEESSLLFTGKLTNQPDEHQSDVVNLIGSLQRKQEAELNNEETLGEWREVAVVVDRVLFVLFLIITIISTVSLLSIRPSENIKSMYT